MNNPAQAVRKTPGSIVAANRDCSLAQTAQGICSFCPLYCIRGSSVAAAIFTSFTNYNLIQKAKFFASQISCCLWMTMCLSPP